MQGGMPGSLISQQEREEWKGIGKGDAKPNNI